MFALASFTMFGQSIPQDFEDGTTVAAFEFGGLGIGNAANPDASGINTSSRVLEVNKPDAADWFGGFGLQTTGAVLIDFSQSTEVAFKIRTPKADLPVRIRVQIPNNGTDPAYNIDVVVSGPVNTWQEITVDFASQVMGTEQYQELVIFPDYDPACDGGGCTTIGAGNGAVHYFDDFTQNIMFDPNTDATLSDLTLDGMTIDGFSPTVTTYDLELPNGTATAPTVAGVATQAGNGSSNVSVTQASGVPGTATLDVTAPNGTDTETYTVNFTEAAALPPAAPTPTEPAAAVISVISNNSSYTDIGTNFIEQFGSVATEVDLDNSGAPDAVSFEGGNGGQFNYFAGSNFFDISDAAIMHFDFYAEGLNAGDNVRVRLFDSGAGGPAMELRITIDETMSGNWQSFDVGLAGAGSGEALEMTGSNIDEFTALGLIQWFPAEAGSTLGANIFYLSNVYFYGGALSTPEASLQEFKVFPNPTNNVWNVRSNTQITNVELFDILGKQVMSIEANNSDVEIDGTKLNTGIYFARISSGDQTKVLRLVRQ